MYFLLNRSSQLLGPKHFPLDRMLAIFYVVVDHKVPPRSKILNQVKPIYLVDRNSHFHFNVVLKYYKKDN